MKSKALLLLVVLSQLTCHQVIFTAPPNSSIACNRNPPEIPAVNGVSVISCLLTEEIGTPVADGTVVQFFTTLGRIPEQGRTNDGVVRVNLESTGRSGTADVTIFSGGGTTIPGGGSSSSTTPTTSLSAESGVRPAANQVTSALSGIQAQTSVSVIIGNSQATQVLVAPSPGRIIEGRTSTITATVLDGLGNPVPGVAVFFDVSNAAVISTPTPPPTATATPVPTATPTPTPTIQPGTPTPTPTATATPTPTPTVTTTPGRKHHALRDDGTARASRCSRTNGQARDTLRTRFPRDGGVRQITVRARTANGASGTTTVFIN